MFSLDGGLAPINHEDAEKKREKLYHFHSPCKLIHHAPKEPHNQKNPAHGHEHGFALIVIIVHFYSLEKVRVFYVMRGPTQFPRRNADEGMAFATGGG